MKYMYKKVFNKDLDAVVKGELSMKTERYVSVCLAGVVLASERTCGSRGHGVER